MARPSPQASEEPPILSAADFGKYNRMAEHMEYFHEHFRSTWKTLYATASSGQRPSNMSLRQFLNTGAGFCKQLDLHHQVEERHIFPILAGKMPAFREELQMLTQHKLIHLGLDKLTLYLAECLSRERELRMEELKEIMDSFEETLWTHLAEEVEHLGAENMRKYWTSEEMDHLIKTFGI